MHIKHTIIKSFFAVFVTVMALNSYAKNPADKNADVWIDVRTPTEYASGHIEKAYNIPFNEIGQRITEVVKDKDKKIDVYCASGGRAEIARKTLVKMGYTHVTNAGGYGAILKKQHKE